MSKAYDPYLAITTHYIESPPNQPNEWSLKSDLIGFTEIHGNHGGANQASIILHIIDHYDICDKVTITFNCLYISWHIQIAQVGYSWQCNKKW